MYALLGLLLAAMVIIIVGGMIWLWLAIRTHDDTPSNQRSDHKSPNTKHK